MIMDWNKILCIQGIEMLKKWWLNKTIEKMQNKIMSIIQDLIKNV